MRIQHNIMAMSAYRNYTNNVSAMKANLEKLSSGYKINRAGDDAAGLAISEKMRAQITGLETAQKNAKDGISLVQTAEGALTEVHDMLNRMVELATQSANGTYDNDTDRAQLQKEMDQLRDEINRIADSSNFNGIKLLDGSMDGGTKAVTSDVPILQTAATDPTTEVGTKTVLREPSTEVAKTSFSIELHDLTFTPTATSNQLKVTIGSTDLTLDFSSEPAGEELDAAKIAAAIKTAFASTTANSTGTANTLNDGTNSAVFDVAVSGTTVTFTQQNDPESTSDLVKADLAVSISNPNAAAAVPGYTQVTPSITDPDSVTVTFNDGDSTSGSEDNATAEFDLEGFDVDKACTVTFTVGGKTYDVEITEDEFNNKGTTSLDKVAAQKLVTALNADKITDADAGDFTATLANDTEITLTSANQDNMANDTAIKADISVAEKATAAGTPAVPSGMTGTYNVETTVNTQGQLAGAGQLASTKFTLTSDIVADGNVLTIGNKEYVFKTDADSEVEAGEGQTLIDVSSYSAANQLDMAGELISRVANDAFTVGYDQANNTISIHEIEGQEVYDKELQSVAEFDKLVTMTANVKSNPDGKALTLQIGDTADSYNQLKVNISDCHTNSLGIADISIADQDSAAAAVDAIKKAINYVSDVRGTLGATQNRLDHTINNLSVMTENIQDAESTIRDVDVAEEMMAYTKNNILIQASQAMLAQANQVPQGVLQLLQ